MLAIGFGHALEWYDWGIYSIFTPFFATQFFDPRDDASAVLSSLAVFAVGFVARPIGGLIVGRLADRIGRRPMMALTVGGMAAASLLIGVSPTYASTGVGASVVLVVARLVQGLATGGELPSAQTYLTEVAPPGRRGLWSSIIYIASVGGNMVGVLLGLVLSVVLTKSEMGEYGWRIPFVVGGLLGLVALWIRRSLEESEAFTREAAVAPAGRQRIWSEIVRHRREAAQVVGLSVGFTVVYYAWVIAAPAYAISELNIDPTASLLAGVLASLVLIAVQPAWGALSDRIGRRPVLLISCVATAVLLFPLQAMVHDAVQLGVAMALAMVFIGAGVAILPAAYAEMFPTRIRAVGLAVPYSIAVAVFGGTAPYLQTWVGNTFGRPAFTGYVVALLAISALTVLTLREGRGSDLTESRPAGLSGGRKGEDHEPTRPVL
ncbi:MFS transporter [Streptomyces violaceusniger]|uniref:MFS transporter n=1 Tax=Streptomyces violaceusniger TaxID=68280 RepID=UPI003427A25C